MLFHAHVSDINTSLLSVSEHLTILPILNKRFESPATLFNISPSLFELVAKSDDFKVFVRTVQKVEIALFKNDTDFVQSWDVQYFENIIEPREVVLNCVDISPFRLLGFIVQN